MASLICTPIADDDAALAATLAAAGLPIDDLTEPGRRFFRAVDAAGAEIGFIGWEQEGTTALLRSLVIAPERRGQGWGDALARWALAQLAENGATAAYMLTTTAARLAARLGFEPLDRADAPEALRRTRQFAGLCPASAALFRKRLG